MISLIKKQKTKTLETGTEVHKEQLNAEETRIKLTLQDITNSVHVLKYPRGIISYASSCHFISANVFKICYFF